MYQASADDVWEAALAAVHDADMSLARTERAKGRIQARTGASDWDVKGYTLVVMVRKEGVLHVRVDVKAEPTVPNGKVAIEPDRATTRYLRVLDHRMAVPGNRSSRCAPEGPP